MKIAVGMSGGVDSAVAALLLKERGFDVVGYTMDLGREGEEISIQKTREVADKLGIELKVLDFRDEWRLNVSDYIRSSYLNAETPNPCVRCNECVKMFLMPTAAFKDGFERFATGHYARVDEDGRLFRGKDRQKDQSYFLYRVPKEILSKVEFPLGGLVKSEVRQLAADFGLVFPDNEESQDFCGGDVKSLIGMEQKKGEIVTLSGKVIGEHNGFWNYTVGMRKGLCVGGGIPYYVKAIDAVKNRVIVGFREEVLTTQFSIRAAVGNVKGECMVKIRSAGEPKGPVNVDGAEVICVQALSGVSPGQSAVFYRGEEIVGGGIIAKPELI